MMESTSLFLETITVLLCACFTLTQNVKNYILSGETLIKVFFLFQQEQSSETFFFYLINKAMVLKNMITTSIVCSTALICAKVLADLLTIALVLLMEMATQQKKEKGKLSS